MIRSLRLRLLLSTSIASSIILTLLGFAIYAFMWHRLLGEFDDGLLTRARTVSAMVEYGDGSVKFDSDLNQLPEFTSSKRPDYFEIWLSDGTVLARSPSLGKKDLPKPNPTPVPFSMPIQLPDGHHGRAIALPFSVHLEREDQPPSQTKLPGQAIVELAGRPIEMNHALDDLGWLLFISCAAAVMISGGVLVRIVGRAVRPVNQLAGQIGLLRETDLSHRLNGIEVPTELEPVVDKLNGLLARLDQSFAREKAFTADVAHELRTPLAGIQTTLEVCRSRARQAPEYESAIDECRAMIGRLHAMIENLLLLARADSGQLPVRRQRTDVYHLIQECWLPLHRLIESKNLHISNTHGGDTLVDIDPDKTRMILQNLLENAVNYVNPGGSIRWSIDRSATQLQITVSNTGSLVSPTDAARLFDRFWRGDQSRTDTGIHCGLGLSLCKRLVLVLNGTIQIETTVGGDFTVRLQFPA